MLLDILAGRHPIFLPAQVLGEAYNVLTKARRTRGEARELVRSAADTFGTLSPTIATYVAALDLAADHKLQVWDALVIRTADDAGCTMLLSEDMQDGFVVDGLTVINPFAPVLHPILAAVIDS